MKKYEIIKYFRGGSTTYYASMSIRKRMKRNCWKFQLEEWGENTAGGFNYGYSINAIKVKSIPKKARRLQFNDNYLTNFKKAKTKIKINTE